MGRGRSGRGRDYLFRRFGSEGDSSIIDYAIERTAVGNGSLLILWSGDSVEQADVVVNPKGPRHTSLGISLQLD